jgi:hypothetical protein
MYLILLKAVENGERRSGYIVEAVQCFEDAFLGRKTIMRCKKAIFRQIK